MKKMIIGIMIGLLLGTAGTALAAQPDAVQAVFAKFNIQIGDQQPVAVESLVYNGTSYYPIRTIADMLGQDVGYEDATRTITLNQKMAVDDTSTATATVAPDLTSGDWIAVTSLLKYGITGIASISANNSGDLSLSDGHNSIHFDLPNSGIYKDNVNIYILKNLLKDLIDPNSI